MTELFEHQKQGIEFLKKKGRVILADEMGLGKTRQAVIAAGESSDESVIVVCPASLKINWEREVHLVYPEDVTWIVNGRERGEDTNYDAAWIIINYDILDAAKEWINNMIVTGRASTIIFDEAHYVKDTKTIRTKAALEIAEHAKRVYCITGTPIMNRPIEMFSLLRAIKHPLAWQEGKAPSGLRRAYSLRYCDGKMRMIFRRGGSVLRFWEETGATRLPELKEMTKDIFLRRTKNEVLDLPEKIVSVVTCDMDPAFQRKYDGAWDEYLDFIAANPLKKDMENIMSARGLVELVKLKQVCSLAKTKRMIEDIENAIEQGQKVIVFSQFTETIRVIAEGLREKKIYTVTLTGQNDMEERQTAVDEFQREDGAKAFVANIKAGGIGLNLTAASIVYFVDMDWSPEIHRQAEDRAHRIGQNGTVNVYYYVLERTIEEDIIDVLTAKQETIGAITGGDTVIPAFMDLIIRRTKATQK